MVSKLIGFLTYTLATDPPKISDINDIIGVTPEKNPNVYDNNESQPKFNNSQNNNDNLNRQINQYDKSDFRPYLVYAECIQKNNETEQTNNISKSSSLKIAREIFNLNLNDVRNVKK